MPDKFGWDNNFGNNPAPTARQKEREFDAFITAIADPVLRGRVQESALANGAEERTELKMWEVALSTAKDVMDDPRGYYPDLFMELPPESRCPKCGDLATYQTPDGTFWDGNAHFWRES